MQNPDETCFIYLLACCTYTNAVNSKIGVSINPEKRAKLLRSYCSGPSSLFKTWEVTRKIAFQVEADVKRKYSEHLPSLRRKELFSIEPSVVCSFVERQIAGCK